MHILGCVVRMVVDSILPDAECGPNDHRKDAPPFINSKNFGILDQSDRNCQTLNRTRVLIRDPRSVPSWSEIFKFLLVLV